MYFCFPLGGMSLTRDYSFKSLSFYQRNREHSQLLSWYKASNTDIISMSWRQFYSIQHTSIVAQQVTQDTT